MADWSITTDVERFHEAYDEFSRRVVISDAERKRIPADARQRAFWIAGVAQLDVVQDVRDKLAKAIAEGTSLEEFKKAVRDQLTKAWGKDDPRRIELIFRNATQHAYNAGLWHQLREPAMLRFRPFWMHDSVLDSRTTEQCRLLDGVIRPAEDPHWDTHWPPGHHGCRRSVRALRRSEAERRGGVTAVPDDVESQEGFGLPPGLAKPWKPEPGSRDAGLIDELERKKVDIEALRPEAAELPKVEAKAPPKPPVRTEIPAPKPKPGEAPRPTQPLTREQKAADQIARWLNDSYTGRARATYAQRRMWMLWEWVRMSTRNTAVLMKEAAIREFGLQGTAWAGLDEDGKPRIPPPIEPASLTRAQADLRRLYEETQARLKKDGAGPTVTLYRGVRVSEKGDLGRGAIESWTTNPRAAERYAGLRDEDGRLVNPPPQNAEVLRQKVPVEKILAYRGGPGWLDGPKGDEGEYLVLH